MYSEEGELFFILVIMGLELVISMSNESISGYRKWLIQNGGDLPLQSNNEIKVNKSYNNNTYLMGKKLNFYSK